MVSYKNNSILSQKFKLDNNIDNSTLLTFWRIFWNYILYYIKITTLSVFVCYSICKYIEWKKLLTIQYSINLDLKQKSRYLLIFIIINFCSFLWIIIVLKLLS
jgi:hypothetical protein